MKSTTKLLNILTAFLGVIGLCTAALVCFIVAYTQITGGFEKKNTADQNIAATQIDDTASENITSRMAQNANSTTDSSSDIDAVNADITNNDMTNTDQGTVPPPSTPDQTSDSNNDVSTEYESALSKAMHYSDMMYMSKAAIYDQLTSEYGERFSPEAAQYAIDNMTADWNYNALQKAKNYQNTMNMSPDAIREQLASEYGDQFTSSEADYAVNNIGTGTASSSELYTAPIEQGSSSTGFTADAPSQSTNTYSSNGNNFNTYNNPEQQQTTDSYVLNTSPDRMKIHYPNCSDVTKIAPENYSTSNLSISELEAQGYSTCGHCFK